jgi:hypothetical protein
VVKGFDLRLALAQQGQRDGPLAFDHEAGLERPRRDRDILALRQLCGVGESEHVELIAEQRLARFELRARELERGPAAAFQGRLEDIEPRRQPSVAHAKQSPDDRGAGFGVRRLDFDADLIAGDTENFDRLLAVWLAVFRQAKTREGARRERRCRIALGRTVLLRPSQDRWQREPRRWLLGRRAAARANLLGTRTAAATSVHRERNEQRDDSPSRQAVHVRFE